MPFQLYLVGVSDSSFDLVASQPVVLSALYFVSFQEIIYLQTDGSASSLVIDGRAIGACQSSLSSSDHDA